MVDKQIDEYGIGMHTHATNFENEKLDAAQIAICEIVFSFVVELKQAITHEASTAPYPSSSYLLRG